MKFEFTKHGQLKHDPQGAQVKMDYRGRTLLGDVVNQVYDDHIRMTFLEVRFFDGSPWPIEPAADCVEVLERTSV